MAPQARVIAARIWLALERSGRPVRLLNHPIRTLRRPELLRSLFDRGINSFNAYPAQRPPAAMRFPVFVRSAHEHTGSLTELIHDRETLDTEIARLEAAGKPRHECLIVEFCDTVDTAGVYRKYDAYIADGRIIPTDMYFSSHWSVKWPSNKVFVGKAPEVPTMTREELAHVSGMAHNEQLLKAIASTQIDYSLLGNQVQIWEINTNPDLFLSSVTTPEMLASPYGREVLPLVCEAIFGVFRSLDSVPEEDTPIPVALAELVS